MLDLLWNIVVILCAIGAVCFLFVIAFGAPFLPTLKPEVTKALNLIDLKPGQRLLELGSGDGRILIEAAKRKIYVVGYELNPILAAYSWVCTRRYRKYITVKCANFWRITLPEADGIFVFLLQPYMAKLDKKISQDIKAPVRLVSFAFHIPGKKITKKSGGMYRYDY